LIINQGSTYGTTYMETGILQQVQAGRVLVIKALSTWNFKHYA